MLFTRKFRKSTLYFACILMVYSHLDAQESKHRDSILDEFLPKMNFRMIGPATTSGRIVDLAVNPQNHSEYYVASAYGGVWKTNNAGNTFQPIFDKYGTQSIGCLKIDPKNTSIIWVGTGENNNQRSVGYGNGVYKSIDGGKTFKNMGLKKSFNVGMITIDASNSNTVWVAAYGNLWGSGGDRGIYKTTDGGESWERKLFVSDHTGFNEVHIDPHNPDILYATSHQRRRHQWTYLGGGPESTLYKSTDAGENWEKVSGGFPGGDLGRISVECSETKPGSLVSIIEGKTGGVYTSDDYGASWKKVNNYQTSGNYYQEVFADPKNGDRLFFMDTYLHFSEDGGETVKRFPEKFKHVDNHAIWIDPNDYQHLLVGCDGGLYESFDYGLHWDFKENLPITQFYRVSVDRSKPFYHVFGGTQDNYSLGGPSRNKTNNGISNEEWYVTVGGDGFKSQIDPNNPNTIYSQWQYGGLIRFNKTTGESIDIKPRVEEALRWNWDAPLIISKYNSNKLYFAANKLFVSNNRGDKWSDISEDLTRKIDRNNLPIMGKVWGLDAVAKNKSTSIYGSITYIVEGKKFELFVGTDDGLIYHTQDDGKNWDLIGNGTYPGVKNWISKSENRKGKTVTYEVFPFVSNLQVNSDGELFAVLDNHKQGDFSSHLVKYSNGKWKRMGEGLPDDEPAKSLWIDPVDEDIVLVGTEFGLYISLDGGTSFKSFRNNLPPVAIKDIVYQEDEEDVVLATFGRGFAVCDEYEKIRALKNHLSKTVSTPKHKLFIPYSHLGRSGNGFHGDSRFRGENLSEKLNLYYYIDELDSSLSEKRKLRESKADLLDQIYPSRKEIRLEGLEIASRYLLSVSKLASDKSVERVAQWEIDPSKGWNKSQWNMRYSFPAMEVSGPLSKKSVGPYVNEGKYFWKVSKWDGESGELIDLTHWDSLEVSYLFKENQLSADDRNLRWTQIQKIRSANQKMSSLGYHLDELRKEVENAVEHIELSSSTAKQLNEIQRNLLRSIHLSLEAINGERFVSKYEFETPESIRSQINTAVWSMMESFEAPTITHMEVVDRSLEKLNELESKYKKMQTTWKSLKSEIDLK